MQVIDLIEKKHSRLLIFFSGWGYDQRCVSHLASSGFDVKVAYDYRQIDNFDPRIFDRYESVTVVAWSFGVWVANKVLASTSAKIKQAYAINGTLLPVNDLSGIPCRVFNLTLSTLDETAYCRFQERVMGCSSIEQFTRFLPRRIFCEQKEELVCLARYLEQPQTQQLNWVAALCGTNDRIFPFANQRRFWGEKAKELTAAHFIFYTYPSWEMLLKEFNYD